MGSSWGGAYGGFCNSTGTLSYQGSFGYYWSQSEGSSNDAYGQYFYSDGYVYPQTSDYFKSSGLSLRCMR